MFGPFVVIAAIVCFIAGFFAFCEQGSLYPLFETNLVHRTLFSLSLVFFIWFSLSAYNLKWKVKEETEYPVYIQDSVAFVVHNNDVVNMNEKLDRDFQEGDKIYHRIYDGTSYHLSWPQETFWYDKKSK